MGKLFLEHQRLLFSDEVKHLEWISSNPESSCLYEYQMTSTAACSDMDIYPRVKTNETMLNISSDQVTHGRNSTFFTLSAVDNEGNTCQLLGSHRFVIQKNGSYDNYSYTIA